MIPGIRGYAEQAADLVRFYEEMPFVEKHRTELHLVPTTPGAILDIGAGTGADAAWLAGQGHRVVAVEPTAELREPGRALHPSPAIEWLDDSLPALAAVRALGRRFDAIMMTAVWMHLDEAERTQAMPIVAALLAPGGALVLSLRHGPVPAGRRMFDVRGTETVALATGCGLRSVLQAELESVQAANRAAGVTWTVLGFRAPGDPGARTATAP